MIWFALLLLVQLSLGAAPVKEIEVSVGESVSFNSPNYPKDDSPGTHHIWKLSTDSDAVIAVTCQDVNITSSRNCKEGFLDISESGMGMGAWCGSLKGITMTSIDNTITANFKLSKVPGYFKCSAKGISKDESQDESQEESQED